VGKKATRQAAASTRTVSDRLLRGKRVNLFRFALLFAIAILMTAGRAYAAPTLTVARITDGSASVSSAPSVTLRRFKRNGVAAGRARWPSPARRRASRGAGAGDDRHRPWCINGQKHPHLELRIDGYVHYTGTLESVTVSAGRTTADDPLDFFSRLRTWDRRSGAGHRVFV